MTPSLTIRPARVSDTPALEGLFEALDEHHRHARPHVFRRPPAERRKQSWLEETIQGPDSTILVVEGVDQRIIGLAVLGVKSVAAIPIRAARQFVEIIELVVAAEARHLGAGRRLIDTAKAWARERDIPALEVSAWAFNRDAIDFYRYRENTGKISKFDLCRSVNFSKHKDLRFKTTSFEQGICATLAGKLLHEKKLLQSWARGSYGGCHFILRCPEKGGRKGEVACPTFKICL